MSWYAVVVFCLAAQQVKASAIACCSLYYDNGIGTGAFGQYYYSGSTNDCVKFIYSGAGGNCNRFQDKETCLTTCGSGGSSGSSSGGTGGSDQHDSSYQAAQTGISSYHVPVNGGWCAWTDWGLASVTCGNGYKMRSRTCTSPAPQYGGSNCYGSGTETMSVNLGACHYAVDGYMTGWSDWGPCTNPCEKDGKKNWKYRTRACVEPSYGGAPCVGVKKVKARCNKTPCEVDGGWGAWCAWSSCSESCGGGSKSRSRKCDNPAPYYGGLQCYGNSQETKSCNTEYCSVDGGWGAWCAWFSCSKSCGGGSKSRSRTCDNPAPYYGGSKCYGKSQETKSCNTEYLDGGWGAWCEWSSCSKLCGGGNCRRSRKCDNPVPYYGGHQCYGNSEETKTCNTQYCTVDGEWGHWGSWSTCSKTCGGGERQRSRGCDNPVPIYGGHYCAGNNVESVVCNTQYCHVDGGWGSWYAWSTCSKSCGGGVKKRSRKCDNPLPLYGGNDCGYNSDVTASCNTQPCPPVVTCPGGAAPLTEYGSTVYCGLNTYNPSCPYGYTCYTADSYNYGSSDHSFSVCCPYDDSLVCELDPDSGPCTVSYAPYYYYNRHSDTCEWFIYGGCGGNWNRFHDLQECQKKCVKTPLTNDCCKLPKNTGETVGLSCQYEFNEWYYNYDTNKCEPFVFSGCGGNANRFHDKLLCDDLCKRHYDTSYNGNKCDQPMDCGEGKYHGLMFYYNKNTDTCEKFRYKGSGGNDNMFYDYWDCEEECRKEPTSPSVCYLPVDTGSGSAHHKQWYFDYATQCCKEFVYQGEGGNLNRFHDEKYCNDVCKNSVAPASVCDLPLQAGDGYDSLDRYYYNQATGACEHFSYTGHGGNDNCFKSKLVCVSQSQICTKPYVSVSACEMPPDSGYGDGSHTDSYYYYDVDTKQCSKFYFYGYGGNDNRFRSKDNCEKTCIGNTQSSDVCDLPSTSGPCYGKYVKYFYNSYSKKCEQFVYGGCFGNDNKFSSKAECESTCDSYGPPAQTVCDLVADSGSGPDYYQYFYYDKATNKCDWFYYYGYSGNGNRFVDYHTCYSTCVEADVNDCSLPMHQGTGDKWEWSYYYNSDDHECQAFIYYGSGGNNNRFSDKPMCDNACNAYKGK